MDLTKIIIAVIGLLVALAEMFLIPWLKTKWDKAKIDKLNAIAKVAVGAAEQLFSTEQWAEKKAHAQAILQSKGYNINLIEVDAAIEAAVLELHAKLTVAQ